MVLAYFVLGGRRSPMGGCIIFTAVFFRLHPVDAHKRRRGRPGARGAGGSRSRVARFPVTIATGVDLNI